MSRNSAALDHLHQWRLDAGLVQGATPLPLPPASRWKNVDGQAAEILAAAPGSPALMRAVAEALDATRVFISSPGDKELEQSANAALVRIKRLLAGGG